jgi:enamine deaminase RidA (YjgF/YER057c/UK114 family)
MRKELDDKEVIIHHAHNACKAIVLQPNDVVGFVVVLDDVIRRPEVLRETCVTHIVPERLGAWPLVAEAMPLSIIAPAATRVTRAVLGMCALVPSASLTAHRGLGASAWIARLDTDWNLGW